MPVLEELNEFGCINIYTEINTIDDINRLVKEFGCHIVYGDTDGDALLNQWNEVKGNTERKWLDFSNPSKPKSFLMH